MMCRCPRSQRSSVPQSAVEPRFQRAQCTDRGFQARISTLMRADEGKRHRFAIATVMGESIDSFRSRHSEPYIRSSHMLPVLHTLQFSEIREAGIY
jgi:hypothetical protein